MGVPPVMFFPKTAGEVSGVSFPPPASFAEVWKFVFLPEVLGLDFEVPHRDPLRLLEVGFLNS